MTRAGAAFLLAILLVAAAAFISANNLLFLILAAMVSTFLVSGFVGRLGLAGLELELLLPQHTSARRKVSAGVRVKNLKRFAPSFGIHLSFSDQSLYFPLIPGGASVEEPMELYFPHRGSHKQRDFQFSTRFPFGFVERSEDVVIPHEVIVYPCLDPRPQFEQLLRSVSAEIATLERGRAPTFIVFAPTNPRKARGMSIGRPLRTREPYRFGNSRASRIKTVVICLDLDVAEDRSGWLSNT